MPLALRFKVSDALMERLDLVEQGEYDGANGGGSGVPIRGWNAEGWRKLAHSARMQEETRLVNPSDLLAVPQSRGCLNGY